MPIKVAIRFQCFTSLQMGKYLFKSMPQLPRINLIKAFSYIGEYFWARGYFVSTVGLDENRVIEYIRHQEKADEQQDQLRLGGL